MGGFAGGRPYDSEDAFEAAVERALGNRLRTDAAACVAMWCALATIEWSHTNGDTASFSLRAAGDLVAAIRGRGDYTAWYGSGPEGVVTAEIADALAREGWTPANR